MGIQAKAQAQQHQKTQRQDLLYEIFEQTKYGETQVPVGKQATFHIMISEATQHGLENDYLNVIAASLNFEVNEKVYMELPEGISEATYNTINNLKKASYGLKTATHLQDGAINCFLSLEFKQSEADPDLYIYMIKAMLVI